MHRTTVSDHNPFKFPLFSTSLDYFTGTVAFGVTYSIQLGYPMYLARYKGQVIAEGNNPARLVLDVVEYLTALRKLKGHDDATSQHFAAADL